MAVDVYRSHNNGAEVHMSVQEFKQIIYALGGVLSINMFHHALCVLVNIWEVLPESATDVRVPILCSAIDQLSGACDIAGIEVRQYHGDGTAPLTRYPRI